MALARYLVLFAVVFVETLLADEVENESSPLQCHICVVTQRSSDSSNEKGCLVTSRNVKTAQCSESHGYNQCMYYRARSVKTGTVFLRRQCATKEMCRKKKCLSVNHTECEMMCCQGNLCNDGVFDEGSKTTSEPSTVGSSAALVTEPVTTDEETTTSLPLPTNQQETTTRPNGISTERPHSEQLSTVSLSSERQPSEQLTTTVSLSSERQPSEQLTTTVSLSSEGPTSQYLTAGQSVLSTERQTSQHQTTVPTVLSSENSEEEEEFAAGPNVPTLTNCEDYREECPYYANVRGYCHYTREFMIKHCQVSCKFCDGTNGNEVRTDEVIPSTDPKTTAQSSTEIDKRTSDTVNKVPTNSPGTTGSVTETEKGSVAGPSGEGCIDQYLECPHYANVNGYCQYWFGFMLSYCQKSCNHCDNIRDKAVEGPTSTDNPTNQADTTSQPENTPPTSTNVNCLDIRENCSYYAMVDGYCDYNNEFMAEYCPFSCGLCGTTLPVTGAFPHPPVFPDRPDNMDEKFPPVPTRKQMRWVPYNCAECRHGYQECHSKCILLLGNDVYEQTDPENCMQLLGKPLKELHC